MKVNSFKFNEAGLNRFFGPLEAKIMDIIWATGGTTIKLVQEQLDEPLAFNTVMTVMNRLVDKEILSKEPVGRQSFFRPTQSKEEFLKAQTREVTEGLLQEFEELTMSHFVDLLDTVKPELLEQLEEKINAVKRRGSKE